MGSIQIFSLHFPNPKYRFPNHSLTVLPKPPPLSINPPIYTHRLCHLLRFPGPKQLSISSKLSKSATPDIPASNFLLERVLISSVIGACIFLASFGWNAKPILALPTQASESSENEAIYEKLLEEGPKDVEALKVLIHGKMKKGKNEEALNYVRKLINIEPDEVEWRFLEALCYEMMGQLSKAKRLYKEILEDKPLLIRALHGLALVMHKSNEGPVMFEMLNKALEIACREKRVTEERNIKILIAQMHVVKGQLEEGLKKYQELINENPRDFRPYLCQGIVYSLLDKKKEADEQFATYQSLVPEEFPERGFIDDIILEARAATQQHKDKERI
ncbi:protein SLOW GREEN 1, chloroplastic [Euphorbia lathyris]|uniref:protein SLOW GREEN 1, chloroplastic n=1 Tax=Euphorbia lathyris TaxID=212925 RepID=UPI003313B4CF